MGYAAYLTGEKLHDERYNETRNFTGKRQRDRIYHSEILAPENAPAWVYEREKLWNQNERAEKRKDSQVAREIHVALPAELTHAEKVAVGLKFARQEYVEKGMVADVSFHNFEGAGSHNPHVHILLTTRRLEGDGFALKKEEAWRPKIVREPKTKRSIVDPEFLMAERVTWERYCNGALRQAGQEQRVDCRSLKERGIDRAPQPKKGKAHYMEQREQWQEQTIAGDTWREAQHFNRLKDKQKKLVREHGELLQESRAESARQAFAIGQELAHEGQMSRQQARRERDRQWQPPAQTPAVSQDDRHLIEQWQQYKDRERDKPRSMGDNHHGAAPERGMTEEQQKLQPKPEQERGYRR